MTLSLLLETSTERGCIALLQENQPIYQVALPFGPRSSQSLIPEIQRGLSAVNKKLSDLTFLSIGIGPGSYTGIRVGAIVGKTLAFALNIPLVTISSLHAFIPSREGKFASAIDAKIGGVYLLTGEKLVNRIKYDGQPILLSLPAASLFLEKEQVISIATPHVAQLKTKLPNLNHVQEWLWDEQSPNVNHLAELCWKKFKERDLTDFNQVDLLYLRKTQAEIEKEEQGRMFLVD